MKPFEFYNLSVQNSFIAVFDTTKPGSISTNLIIPFARATNCIIFWGDGTRINYTGVTSASHSYSVAGTYTVIIIGQFTLKYANGGDKAKIISILKWGDCAIGDSAFWGCLNLRLNEVQNVPKVFDKSLFRAFSDTTSITTINGVNKWKFTNVTDINRMFLNSNFNGNLENWNVSNLTGTSFGFLNVKTPVNFTPENLDKLLIGWSSRPVKPNVIITMANVKRTPASDNAKLILTSSPNNWSITDGGYA